MPKKLGEFLNAQALKAGVKSDDRFLIDLLSRQGLNDIELPDEYVSAVDNNLLSIETARAGHPLLKSAYYARAYSGLDAELNDLMAAHEFDPDTIAQMKAEASSTKRTIAIANKIKELTAARIGATAPDKATIAKQINELQAALAQSKANENTIKSQYEGQIKSIKVRAKLDNILSGYKTVYDELPVEAKTAAINALLDQKLQESSAEFTFTENGSLDLKTKDGLAVFGPNHIQLTPQAFLDTTLAKILKQTPAPSEGQSKNIQTNGSTAPQGQAIAVSPSFAAAIAASRQSWEAATKPQA